MTSILGAIGLTEGSVQLLRWMVCGPEVANQQKALLVILIVFLYLYA